MEEKHELCSVCSNVFLSLGNNAMQPSLSQQRYSPVTNLFYLLLLLILTGFLIKIVLKENKS